MRPLLGALALTALFGIAPLSAPLSADPVVTVDSAAWRGSTLVVTAHADAVPAAAVQGLSATLTVNGVQRQAQLQVTQESVTSTPVQQTVMLVLDASGSMAGPRLRAANVAAARFLAGAPAIDPIGVVAFSDTARLLLAPTLNHDLVTAAISGIRARGNTALFDAVALATRTAAGARQCTVLVLSDGQDTSSRINRLTLGNQLRASNCVTSFVGFQATPAMMAVLDDLATAGRGRAFTKFDAAGIADVFARSLRTASGRYVFSAMFPPVLAHSTSEVSLAVSVGGTTSRATAPVAPAVVPVPPSASGAQRISTDAMLVLLALFTGLGIFAFAWLVSADMGDRRHRRHAGKLIETYAMRRVRVDTVAQPRTMLDQLEDLVRPVLARKGRAERLGVLLDGAAVNRSPEQWVLISAGLGLALTAVFTMLSGSLPAALLMGMAISSVLPNAFLKQRRGARSKRFEAGLPDALMLVASSLRSGFALDQAIVAAADQSDNEVATELKRAVQEIRIGAALEDALERAAIRINSADFLWVVTALRIQRRSGGNLAELLITVSKTVRQRADLAREVRALTAEGRMSAYTLMGLPIGLFGFLMITQPSYLTPLWTEPLGWAMSAAAITMLTIGWLLMNRMIKVEI